MRKVYIHKGNGREYIRLDSKKSTIKVKQNSGNKWEDVVRYQDTQTKQEYFTGIKRWNDRFEPKEIIENHSDLDKLLQKDLKELKEFQDEFLDDPENLYKIYRNLPANDSFDLPANLRQLARQISFREGYQAGAQRIIERVKLAEIDTVISNAILGKIFEFADEKIKEIVNEEENKAVSDE
jgi:alpha-amylase/alpha-mannosidase (GH57 family)